MAKEIKTELTRSEVEKHMFDFRPQLGEDGNPKHWLPKVMPDADNAWYYEQGE